MTATTMTPIQERAVLVRLSVSSWAARRFDKKVTNQTNAAHAASKDAGRYNKHLLGGKAASPSHAATVNAASAARKVAYAETLSWGDDGFRLLPTKNYVAYTDAVREARATFEANVETFLADYPALVEQARALLNGMFREEDYPSVEELRRKFSMSVEFSPVPSDDDFRLDLPADQISTLAASVNSRVERATKDAMDDAWARLRESVQKVADRLNDPDAPVYDSLIGNVKAIADVLSRLNVTDDPDLEAMRKMVEKDIAGIAPDVMRKNKPARAAAAQKADAILEAMRGVYGD